MQSKFIALVAGTALSLGLVSASSAADMAVKARPVAAPMAEVYNWTGFYVGLNGGWMSSNVSWTYHDPAGGVVDRPISNQRMDAAIFGGHISYLWQFSQFVVGLEAMGLGTSGNYGSTPCFNPAFNCQARVTGGIVLAGPKAGVAFNNVLAYVNGGYAYGRIETQEVLVATGVVNAFSTSANHNGWYAGGGIDYAINRNWILGVQYSHIFWESKDQLSTTPSEHRRIGGDSDLIQAKLSYHFGGPVVAKY